jgi:hypothetical protein
MDGELDARAAQRELNRLEPGSELREHWDSYHLIGDALRGEPILSRAFGHRLSERLAGEPTVLAPRRSVARRVTTYALSAAASLSAVAGMGGDHYPDAHCSRGGDCHSARSRAGGRCPCTKSPACERAVRRIAQ